MKSIIKVSLLSVITCAIMVGHTYAYIPIEDSKGKEIGRILKNGKVVYYKKAPQEKKGFFDKLREAGTYNNPLDKNLGW